MCFMLSESFVRLKYFPGVTFTLYTIICGLAHYVLNKNLMGPDRVNSNNIICRNFEINVPVRAKRKRAYAENRIYTLTSASPTSLDNLVLPLAVLKRDAASGITVSTKHCVNKRYVIYK